MDIKFHEGLTLRWFETPEWSVFVDERGVPNGFEHAERGDECGGGLWFDGRVLVDYDGVFAGGRGCRSCRRRRELRCVRSWVSTWIMRRSWTMICRKLVIKRTQGL
jgi:hypothetical protein